MDKNYEKKTAKEMLSLVEKYNESEDKKEISERLHKISGDVYYKNRGKASQKMVDVALAINSFTQAGLSGGKFQDFDEFVQDLMGIIEG